MPIPDNDADRFTRAVYVISVAAELSGMHPQTLRIYERKGLVDPARTDGGSRRYSDADLAQLNRIQELTNDGLNLAGVKRVLILEARVADLEQRLEQAVHSANVAAETTLRHYRGELVPINQSITLYKRGK
ncbi:MAG: helix-turn-helix transcriptional regulator [Acidimicrobiaceae bacterium]|jgi:MerR family transcriptional regulator, heat shock protein HspR|nr:helix-turn-helix transcriptional regulator [Acidimicrobiaceae bacterium]MBT5580438.1 helix-turn-helix transcriptional regulator [Acidimicrobiaceae bacterium]MBT5849031.1 helix-turn-helix transcriptional regulator [Acidimicrobiaceae bacterium]